MAREESLHLPCKEMLTVVDALIIVLDPGGKIVFLNPACEKLTGYLTADVAGKLVWDVFFRGDEIPRAKKVIRDMALHRTDNRQIHTWRTSAGEKKLIAWSNRCLEDNQGNLLYIVGTGTDITNRRKKERSRLETEAKFKTIINSAPDSIIIINETGTIQEVNPALGATFGYSEDELIGQNVSMLMPEPYRSHHDDNLARYKKTQKGNIIGIGREIVAQHKNGTIFPIILSVSESRLEGRVLFTGIIRDITKRKQQEEKLRRAYRAEAVGQLTGGVAHDFNNLLTIMLGNLEMLETYVSAGEPREILDEVFEVVDQGTQLVSQLLTFGRRQQLKPETVNVNTVVHKLIKLIHRTLREDIKIEFQSKPNLWLSHVDPGQLENALLNMVVNARDAMPGGGKITIRTCNKIFSHETATCGLDITPGSYVELRISDTGKGMPTDVVERACDPFFTTKGVGIGTGLGLSMVHGFVKQSSGNMHIQSTIGEGTDICLFLPKYDAQTRDSSPTEKKVQPDEQGKGMILLHVEDDPKVRHINTRRLMARGYHVLTAKDSPSALEILAERDDIDIVFSDIVMPSGLSGIELAKILKATKPHIRVLLTTGYNEEAFSSDMPDFPVLRKPFSGKELDIKLAELMEMA